MTGIMALWYCKEMLYYIAFFILFFVWFFSTSLDMLHKNCQNEKFTSKASRIYSLFAPNQYLKVKGLFNTMEENEKQT